MKAFISHHTALNRWKVPNAEEIIGYKHDIVNQIDLTMNVGRVRRKKGYLIHYINMDKLPSGSIKFLDQQAISSPELLFLQMATELSFERLVLLGLQLCSYPVNSPDAALSTRDQLSTFLNQMSNIKGIRNAKRAIPYIQDGAASVLESLLYMNLTLPYRFGGYGFPELQFNYELWLSHEDANLLGKKRLLIDLCIPSKMIAIEYMSNKFHNDLNFRHDLLRKNTLERLGFRVFWIQTRDFYDLNQFNCIVNEIARMAKHRIRIRNEAFYDKQQNLHTLLPRTQNSIDDKRHSKESFELEQVDNKIWDRAYASQFLTNPNLLLSIMNPSHINYRSHHKSDDINDIKQGKGYKQ